MMMMNPMCAEKAKNRLPNILGCPGFQSVVRGNPPDVALDHLKCTNFGQFFVNFAAFQPLWCHTEAKEEPKLLFKVPFNLQEEHGELYRSGKEAPNIEIWLCREVPPFSACRLRYFWNNVRISHSCLRATFEVWEKPPAHA